MPTYLSRDEALAKLQSLLGQDLRQLAIQYGITVFKENAGFNKGWAGTMINPADIISKPFRQSHLYNKLFRMIVCGRLFVDREETYTTLERCETFDFDDYEDKELIDQIEQDYENVRQVLSQFNDPREGLRHLSGRMGIYVQPRTKGPGHGSISRAFYMRTRGLKKLLKL